MPPLRRPPSAVVYATRPLTHDEVLARGRDVQAELYGYLARDPRDDVPGRPDVVNGVGWRRAPEIPPDGGETPAEACRRYLRRWKRARYRAGWEAEVCRVGSR